MGPSATGRRAGATLADLVSLRSQDALAVMGFHEDLTQALDTTPWSWPEDGPIRASEVAVEPMVLTKAERTDRPVERARADEWARRELALSPLEEIDAARYELPTRLEGRQERRWGQVIRQGRARLAVKGAPGSGKTFITRHTVAELGRQAKAHFEAHEVSVQETPAAVWVTATALAQTSAAAPDEALVEALAKSLALSFSTRARRWLIRALTSPRALIVIDALDELRQEDLGRFRERAAWADRLPGRVMVTCRTLQWEERRNDLGWPRVTEVELAPLARRQQRALVQKMFAGEPSLAQRLNAMLQANGALRHACTTALLRLMFACLLHRGEMVCDDTTYAQLYSHLVRRLVAGAWRVRKPRWADSEVQTEGVLLVLEGIAWELFHKAPEANRFALLEWEQAAAKAVTAKRASRLAPDVLVEELQGVGFLVLAGFDGHGDRCWSFAHRTILEFLAARALARRPRGEWLGEARRHFWFEPTWMEVLTFLAGLVDDATPLIEAVQLEQQHDDIFGSMQALKARLVGGSRKIDSGIVTRAIHEVMSYLLDALYLRRRGLLLWLAFTMIRSLQGRSLQKETEGTVRFAPMIGSLEAVLYHWPSKVQRRAAAEALATLLGSARALDFLVGALSDGDDRSRAGAAMALGVLGEPRAAEPLVAALHDRDPTVRSEVAHALVELAADRAVEPLVAALRDPDSEVRMWAGWALGELGAERAVGPLIVALRDPNRSTGTAAKALSLLGAEEGVDSLLTDLRDADPTTRHSAEYDLRESVTRASDRLLAELTAALSDPNGDVRKRAAALLAKLGSEQTIGPLMAALRDADGEVRRYAAWALGKLGAERAAKPLIAVVKADPDRYARCAAVEALGAMPVEEAFEPLVAALSDHDWRVSRQAAWALGELGDRRAVEPLIVSLGEGHSSERAAAAQALGALRADRATEALLAALTGHTAHVRGEAALALGELGTERALEPLAKVVRSTCDFSYDSPEGTAYKAAVWALGKIGSVRAIDALEAPLRDGRLDSEGVETLYRLARKHRVAVRIN